MFRSVLAFLCFILPFIHGIPYHGLSNRDEPNSDPNSDPNTYITTGTQPLGPISYLTPGGSTGQSLDAAFFYGLNPNPNPLKRMDH